MHPSIGTLHDNWRSGVMGNVVNKACGVPTLFIIKSSMDLILIGSLLWCNVPSHFDMVISSTFKIGIILNCFLPQKARWALSDEFLYWGCFVCSLWICTHSHRILRSVQYHFVITKTRDAVDKVCCLTNLPLIWSEILRSHLNIFSYTE